MYLERPGLYTKSSEQHTYRGNFLLLLQVEGEKSIHACVRLVSLRPSGNFMMGKVNISGKWVSCYGEYGNSGLPKTVGKLPKDAVVLPDELHEAWNKGEGWNGAGNEADLVREWAKKTFKMKQATRW